MYGKIKENLQKELAELQVEVDSNNKEKIEAFTGEIGQNSLI